MLKFLRKKENVKMIMFWLAILIIPAFVFWGTGSAYRSKSGKTYAGKIFGKKIQWEDFLPLFQKKRRQLSQVFTAEVPEKIILQFTWNELILLAEARKEKIKVHDEEVIAAIASLPDFQRDGEFDRDFYVRVLGGKARNFEKEIRKELLLQKLRQKVMAGIEVTEEEVLEEYKKSFENIEKTEGAEEINVVEGEEPEAEFEQEKKESIKDRLLQQKRSTRYAEWFNKLRKGANLQSNYELAEEPSQPKESESPQPE